MCVCVWGGGEPYKGSLLEQKVENFNRCLRFLATKVNFTATVISLLGRVDG